MDISEIQPKLKIWADYNFPNATPYQPLLGVAEEVGELCHAHLKCEQNIRTKEGIIWYDEKVDAIGDIIIYLADYCNKNNIDMNYAVIETMMKVLERDWVKYPKNGVSE